MYTAFFLEACFILGFVPHNELFFFKESKYLDVSIENFKTIIENYYLKEAISCFNSNSDPLPFDLST